MVRICTDRITALYDTVLDVCVVSKIDIVQNNRILDHAVFSDENLLKQNRILHITIDNTAV